MTNLELLRAWVAARRAQPRINLAEFAQTLGLPYNSTRMKIYRAQAIYGEDIDPGPGEDQTPEAPPAGQVGDRITRDQDTNNLTLESGFGQRITTLEALLEFAQVDLADWTVERWVINKWEVGAKGPDGSLNVAPLIQVKAWLIRKVPVEVTPVIKPVQVTVTPLKTARHMGRPQGLADSGLRAALILPDPQIGYNRDLATNHLDPFHDRRALDVALQVAAGNHWDDIILLGDLLDLPDWSDKFTRSPEFYFNTQSAIIEAAWWLAQLRAAAPAARLVVIEGNHERRLREAISNHLAASYQLKPAAELAQPAALSLPRLLGLQDLGAVWVGDYPRSRFWLNDSLAVLHGSTAKKGPGDTARAMLAESNCSVIFGHIHRREVASRTLGGRDQDRTIAGMSPGCLCRLDYVVPGHEPGQNWQQGLGVAYYDPAGLDHHLEVISLESGRAIWGGQVYQGQDRLPDLFRDSGWAHFA